MLFIKLLDYLHCKPFTGFFTSIIGWYVGTNTIASVHAITSFQEVLLWWFQLFALIIGSTAGIFTIVSLISRKKKKCK